MNIYSARLYEHLVSNDKKKTIEKLKMNGHLNIEIADILNISYQRVSQILKKDFVDIEKKKYFISFPLREPKYPHANRVSFQLKGRERTREMVRARDNYTCQDCGKKWIRGERRFDVHHIGKLCGKKSRAYDRVSSMDTMVTFCHKCHFNRPEHKSKKHYPQL